jgi:cadherin 4 type 1 (R-cadherin)
LFLVGYTDTITNRRPALGDYIDEKLTEQQIAAYANDTQLHYRYEGEGSIASDLSSLESSHSQDEHDYRFLYSWGPKFSRLADLYAGGMDDDDDDDIDHA